MKKSRLLAEMMTAVMAASTPLPFMNGAVNAAGGVDINSTFPDTAFRDYVHEEFDTNGDWQLSSTEIKNAKSIFTFGLKVNDFTGIEVFTELNEFVGTGEKISKLDFSNNTKLKELEINGSHLKSIDLTNNTKLEKLLCSDCDFTKLDLSSNTELTYLSATETKLKSIDLSKNTKLKTLDLDYNYDLTTLDVSANKELESLGVYCTKLTELKLGNNDNLKFLTAVGIEADSIDISGCPVIVDVYLHGEHPSTELDQLYYFRDGYDDLASLSVSPDLHVIYGQNSEMKWKRISGKWYYIDGNGLKTTGMKDIGNKRYYFDKNGVMQTGWVDVDGEGHWHYFNSEGVMQNGWFKVGTKWYFCYWYESILQNGIYDLGYGDNELYRFDKNGAMLTGWYKNENGDYLYFTSNGAAKGWRKIGKVWYFFDKDTCIMLTGPNLIDGSIYLFSDSGAMLSSGWKQYGSNWYYLTKSGAAYRDKWLKSGKKWYYFDSDGVMLKSTKVTIKGVEYEFDASGAMK